MIFETHSPIFKSQMHFHVFFHMFKTNVTILGLVEWYMDQIMYLSMSLLSRMAPTK